MAQFLELSNVVSFRKWYNSIDVSIYQFEWFYRGTFYVNLKPCHHYTMPWPSHVRILRWFKNSNTRASHLAYIQTKCLVFLQKSRSILRSFGVSISVAPRINIAGVRFAHAPEVALQPSCFIYRSTWDLGDVYSCTLKYFFTGGKSV